MYYNFENEETKEYFFEVAKKYGIMHICADPGTVMTRENIDLIVKACEDTEAKYFSEAK